MKGYFQGKRAAEAKLAQLFPNGGVALRPGFIHGTRNVAGVGIPLQAIGTAFWHTLCIHVIIQSPRDDRASPMAPANSAASTFPCRPSVSEHVAGSQPLPSLQAPAQGYACRCHTS